MRVCLIGEASVGKTTLCHDMIGITKTPSPTIGLEFHVVNYKNNKIQLWDTAGEERYRALLPMYLRRAKIIIYVISALNLANEKYSYWLQYINDNAENNYKIIIVITKCDLFKNYKNHIVFLKDFLPKSYILYRYNNNISKDLLDKIVETWENIVNEESLIDNNGIEGHFNGYVELNNEKNSFLNTKPSCCN